MIDPTARVQPTTDLDHEAPVGPGTSITATGELARADDWVVSPIRLRTGAPNVAGAVVVAGVATSPGAAAAPDGSPANRAPGWYP